MNDKVENSIRLFEACHPSNTLSEDKIRELTACDFDPNFIGPDGDSLLCAASFQGNASLIRTLLEAGADPNLGTEGYYALLVSAAFTDIESVRALLDFKANPDVRDADKDTSLHIAACLNDVGIVRLLLEHGANPELQNHSGCTAAEIARKRNFCLVADMIDNRHKEIKDAAARQQALECQKNVFNDNMTRYNHLIPNVRRQKP